MEYLLQQLGSATATVDYTGPFGPQLAKAEKSELASDHLVEAAFFDAPTPSTQSAPLRLRPEEIFPQPQEPDFVHAQLLPRPQTLGALR